MVPTIAMAIVMGVVPGLFLRPTEPAVDARRRAPIAGVASRRALERSDRAPPSERAAAPGAARRRSRRERRTPSADNHE